MAVVWKYATRLLIVSLVLSACGDDDEASPAVADAAPGGPLVLDVPPEKANAVTEQFGAAGLVRRRIDAVDYALDADREARELLAGMGPSAHHAASLNPDPDPTSTAAVTVAVDVLTFAHTSHHDG